MKELIFIKVMRARFLYASVFVWVWTSELQAACLPSTCILKLASGLSLTCTAYAIISSPTSLIQRQLGQLGARLFVLARFISSHTQKKLCSQWISLHKYAAVVHAPAYPITRRVCCHLAQSTLTHATASKQSQLLSALELAILLRQITPLAQIEISN